jgi:hypothetical protein
VSAWRTDHAAGTADFPIRTTRRRAIAAYKAASAAPTSTLVTIGRKAFAEPFSGRRRRAAPGVDAAIAARKRAILNRKYY